MNRQSNKRFHIIGLLREMIAKKPDIDLKSLELWICQNHDVSVRTAREYIRVANG